MTNALTGAGLQPVLGDGAQRPNTHLYTGTLQQFLVAQHRLSSLPWARLPAAQAGQPQPQPLAQLWLSTPSGSGGGGLTWASAPVPFAMQ